MSTHIRTCSRLTLTGKERWISLESEISVANTTLSDETRKKVRSPRSGRVEFRVGNVLGRGFVIWFRNLIPFCVLTLLVYSPLIIYTAAVLQTDPTEEALTTYWYVNMFASFCLQPIAAGALIYGVFQQLRGKTAGILDCMRAGLARMWPVLGVGLLVGLFVAIGFILLIVPGIILYCRYWVAIPVAVVERPGVGASLSRSALLTQGHKGGVFLILLLLGIIHIVSDVLIEQSILGDSIETISPYLWAVLGTNIGLGSIGAVMQAVGYHDLRAAKEGIGIEELTKVFE